MLRVDTVLIIYACAHFLAFVGENMYHPETIYEQQETGGSKEPTPWWERVLWWRQTPEPPAGCSTKPTSWWERALWWRQAPEPPAGCSTKPTSWWKRALWWRQAPEPPADHHQQSFRPYINCAVGGITCLMCGWWIHAANQGWAKGMKVAFAWILLQAVGNAMYVYGCVSYETIIMRENVISTPAAAYMYSHSTRIAVATAWLLGEAYVLSRMHEFQSVFMAPDY